MIFGMFLDAIIAVGSLIAVLAVIATVEYIERRKAGKRK